MYIELHTRSAFSFLRGSSLPEQLAEVAAELQMPTLALCDRDGLYGAPRFFGAAKEKNLRPIIGTELTMEDGSVLPVLVENRTGYQNLCQLLTRGHLRNAKGETKFRWSELPEFAEGLVALTGDEEGALIKNLCRRRGDESLTSKGQDQRFVTSSPTEVLDRLVETFGPNRVFIEIQRHHLRGEERINNALIQLAEHTHLPLLATNGVLYAKPYARQVHDVFTCIRNHTHLDAAGTLLAPNSERFLKTASEMESLFHDLPEAIENTAGLADRLQFTLADLGYEFPKFPVGPGETMDGVLREQTLAGARKRYDGKIPEKVAKQIKHELALIGKLGFAGYFLIVADLVKFCRENDIMCQGRGSAANSTVCFCLGITAVDPLKFNTLFERFLSEGRKGWPDIDIDLPSGDRRERVIQEVYKRYGKHGAAMTANVISYRGKSAAREIGKALNLSNDVIDRFSHLFANGDFPHTMELAQQMEQAGLPADHPRATSFVNLYKQIYALPRHLGQHSGGMIICQGKLSSVVPLENASMPGRVVAQWDKDDCEDLGIIKVDLLGLGMMSVIQDAITLVNRSKSGRGLPQSKTHSESPSARGEAKLLDCGSPLPLSHCEPDTPIFDLAKIPIDDEKTFKMMQEADTIGVFQIESRAQMATLPRMKPKCFYDVVIEVAIIRPGPIQGDLMHPYLNRRAGREPETYYDERLRPVLERTKGVPLFQEQLLQIAMVMADLSPGEAEDLRRALSFHRSEERMNKVVAKMQVKMEQKGITADVIQKILKWIGSFALYGFPESHAISFAILAYGSTYLKVHHAPEFYASLLNNHPMGFYSPATIVKDAKRHGVKTLPVCIERSDWLCAIEDDGAIRLGFCIVQGLRHEHGQRIVQQRARKPFASIDDFKWRTGLNKAELRTLAEIGALNKLAKHRRDALWQVEKDSCEFDLFNFPRNEAHDSEPSPLEIMNAVERVRADYHGTNLSTGPHPMALVRADLPDVWRASDLSKSRNGETIRIAGNVICRQRPGTAKGFVFISLEDETGISNAIVNPDLFEDLRLVITHEPFLIIEGIVQNRENVVLVQAKRIMPMPNESLAAAPSYDFH